MALPLVTFEKTPTDEDKDRTTMILHKENLESVLNLAGDQPLCSICICGPSRKGKSFLLGYIMRCLHATEKGIQDWMDWKNPQKPLDTAFEWKNGQNPVTQGIWIWAKPFIVTSAGRQVAVIIVDTQGTNDEFTSNRDMASIVGLSLLLSSVTIFNFFTSLQEDILSSLRTYMEYGKIAKENSDGENEKPFQKLTFLIRDWNDPDSCNFGKDGGKKLLKETLKIKDNQPENAREVRMKIGECFQELDCFLMPHIGQKALRKHFDGNVAELDQEFAQNMETFINELVRSKLLIKTLVGREINGMEFRDYMSMYVNAFNANTIPSAMSMWQATALAADNITLGRATTAYKDALRQCKGDRAYLNPVSLTETHQLAITTVKEMFQTVKIYCGIEEFQAKLAPEIHNEFASFQLENNQVRQIVLHTVDENAQAKFIELYTADDELQDGKFIPDVEISCLGAKAKQAALHVFENETVLETAEDQRSGRENLNRRFLALISATLIKNEQNKRNIEGKLESLIGNVLLDFNTTIEDWLKSCQDPSIGTLAKELNGQKNKCLTSFQSKNTIGDEMFKNGFSTKLLKQIEISSNIFVQECELLEAKKRGEESKQQFEIERQRNEQEKQRVKEMLDRQIEEQRKEREMFQQQAEIARAEAEERRKQDEQRMQQILSTIGNSRSPQVIREPVCTIF